MCELKNCLQITRSWISYMCNCYGIMFDSFSRLEIKFLQIIFCFHYIWPVISSVLILKLRDFSGFPQYHKILWSQTHEGPADDFFNSTYHSCKKNIFNHLFIWHNDWSLSQTKSWQSTICGCGRRVRMIFNLLEFGSSLGMSNQIK